MLRKLFVIVLACMLLNLCCVAPVAAASQTTPEEKAAKKDAKHAAKIKRIIKKLGATHDSQIELVLRDDSELGGYVCEINDDHFVVADLQTNAETKVSYAEVEKIKFASLMESMARKETFKGFARKVAIGMVVFIGVVAVICRVGKPCSD